MASPNEDFLDAVIRHQIYLMRLSQGIRKKINVLLNETEEDIARRIKADLLGHTKLTPAALRRINALEKYIKSVRLKSWKEIDQLWLEEITELAKTEPAMLATMLKTTAPVVLDLALPHPEVLAALVTNNPFEGKTLKQWSSSIQAQDLDRIMSQIKIGVVQGETSTNIARRIVGTAQLKGVNGVTEITRRHAASITRTAVNSISNMAKRKFYEENKKYLQGEVFVATLDSKTTPVCRANDGKIYPVGEGPMPSLHWGCRSMRVALMGGELIGTRPAKRDTEKILAHEYTLRNKLTRVNSRAALPFGHKGAFDIYKQRRIRELTEIVPAKTNYQSWLEKQSNAFQDDVLGVTKAKLFRKGKLPLDKFVNRSGDELTLSELATKHSDAFRAAGLEPENFL